LTIVYQSRKTHPRIGRIVAGCLRRLPALASRSVAGWPIGHTFRLPANGTANGSGGFTTPELCLRSFGADTDRRDRELNATVVKMTADGEN
jgi:hypothetical protein